MTKIALFLPSFGGGGAERIFIRIANKLHLRGHDVHLVVAHHSGELAGSSHRGVRIINLGVRRTSYSFFKFFAYLKSEKPDVVMSCTLTPNLILCFVAALRLFECRLILSERAVLSQALKNISSFVRILVTPFVKILYTSVDQIIAVSDDVKSDLVNEFSVPAEKISVVLNPVYDSAVDCPKWKPRHFEGRYYICSIGRLNPQKDHFATILAFSKVCNKFDVNLVILGEGLLRANLEAFIKMLGLTERVFLLGFRKRPDLWLSRASLFISSSRFEGLPGSVIESVRVGLPIVARDCPGGMNEILHNGLYGSLVALDDDNAFRTAIESMLEKSLCSRFVPEKSRLAHLEEKFSVEKQVDKYQAILVS